jgi:hypothetical protein
VRIALTSSLVAVAAVLGAEDARAQGITIEGAQQIVLGEVEQVPILIDLPEPPDAEGRPLQVVVSAGRIDELTRIGSGRYRAMFRTPPTRFPQVAIVAFWYETGADADVQFQSIPLYAKTKLPYKTKPGVDVRILVGSESFGPVTADRKGVATVPIVVPPGVRDVAVSTSERTKSTVAVKVPPYNRLAMVATPYLVPGDGVSSATLHIYYEGDQPPPASQLRIAVSSGEVKPGSADRNHYKVQYTPGKTVSEHAATIGATMEGDSTSKAQVELQIGSPVGERMVAKVTDIAGHAPNGASGAVFDVFITDARGLGVSKLQVSGTPSAGTVVDLKDMGNGHYRVLVVAPPGLADRRIGIDFSALLSTGKTLGAHTEGVLPESGIAAQVVQEQGPKATTAAAAAPFFFIGARVGGLYAGAVEGEADVDFGIRPRPLAGKLGVALSIGYRIAYQSFTVHELNNAQVASQLSRVPVMLALDYNFYEKESLRVYGSAAGGVSFVTHSISADFQPAQSFHMNAATGRLAAGVGYGGLVAELGGVIMPLSSSQLSVPTVAFGVSIGYRLGIL